MRYHINPETGNPGICRAKIKCRFGDMEEEHYNSKTEAQKAYEKIIKYDTYSFTQLLNERNKLQLKIMDYLKNKRNIENYSEVIKPLITDRNNIDDRLKNYSSAKLTVKKNNKNLDKIYSVTPLNVIKNDKTITGIPNDILKFNKNYPEMSKEIEHITNEWVERLSDEQLRELWRYANDSSEYAKKAVENYDYNEYFNKIIDAAPTIEPINVYSGVSNETRMLIAEQLKNNSKIIHINRGLSTSINPAQVNGFMFNDNGDDYGNIALVVETDRGAFLQNFSASADEFEVLVSKGDFEIIKIENNIDFIWDERTGGRTANTLLHLKKI